MPVVSLASPPTSTANPITLPRASSYTWQLRRELYKLRDEVQRTVEGLSQCTSCLPPSATALAADVAQRYRTQLAQLSHILSNHGSDWIESALSGGMTYAEFEAIDIGTIRDFTSMLAATWRSMGFHPAAAMPSTSVWTTGPEHHRRLLVDRRKLYALETLAEVLTATLNPPRN